MKKLNLKEIIDNFDLEGLHKHNFIVVITIADEKIISPYDSIIDKLEQFDNYNLVSATLCYEDFSLDNSSSCYEFVVRIVLSNVVQNCKNNALDFEDYSFLKNLVFKELDLCVSSNHYKSHNSYTDALLDLAFRLDDLSKNSSS